MTISDERLAEMRRGLDGLELSYQSPHEMLSLIDELQSRRSTHEAEAVAWRGDSNDDDEIRKFTAISRVAEIWTDQGLTVTPLYLHPSSSIEGVKVPNGKWSDREAIYEAAIAAYEAATPPDYRYSAIAMVKAIDAAIAKIETASLDLSPKPLEITEDAEVLRSALADLVSWFDGGPSRWGPWIIEAGEHGADAAVDAARGILNVDSKEEDVQ